MKTLSFSDRVKHNNKIYEVIDVSYSFKRNGMAEGLRVIVIDFEMERKYGKKGMVTWKHLSQEEHDFAFI